MPKKYSKKFLISELQRLAKELGRNPSYDKLKRMKVQPAPSVYAKTFGSWNKAKEAAGLKTFDKKGWTEGAYVEKTMFNPLEHPFEFGYVYGVLIGDGSFAKNSIALNTKDMDFIECFKENAERLTGYPCSKISYREGKWMDFPSGHHGYSKPIHTIRLTHKGFVDWLRKDDAEDGWKKYAEQYPEFTRGFIKGFFDSEGQVYCVKRKYNYKYFLSLCGIDKHLMETIQKLLITVLDLKRSKLKADTRSFRKHTLYVLRFANYSEDFIRFYDMIGVTIKRKRPSAQALATIRKSAEKSYKMKKAYPIAIRLFKEGLTPSKIRIRLKEQGYNVIRPTIESWVYRLNVPAAQLYKRKGAKSKGKFKRGKLRRFCLDCNCDISERHYAATRCEACAKERRRKYYKEYMSRPEVKKHVREYQSEWRKKKKKS